MKTFMIGTGAALALFALPAGPATATPATAMPATVAVTGSVGVVISSGSGCANRSAVITDAPDGSGFTATYRTYLVTTDPISETRKNCLFLVQAQPPAGYRYSALQVDSSGTVRLSEALTAHQQTVVSYQGAQPQARLEYSIPGPRTSGWQTSGTVDLTSIGVPACGAATGLLVNTSLNVPGRSGADPAANTITTDATRMTFTMQPCA